MSCSYVCPSFCCYMLNILKEKSTVFLLQPQNRGAACCLQTLDAYLIFKTVRQREERALSCAWLWPCSELQGCGFCCQVEYCPCVIANDCWNLLMEFMQSFMGSHTPGIPSVFGTKHDSIYSPADTMVQYMELFNKIRKQQQVPVAGIR